jgi:hypothetical protein
MARLSHLLITLPLMVTPVFTLGLKPAAAETATPIDALELLAKASAVDAKCKVLPSSGHDELNGYLARAEIATTARYSVDDAKQAISLGRSSGDVAPCSPTAGDEVQATLAAAREAMVEVQSRSSPVRAKRVASLTSPKETVQPDRPDKRASGALGLYGRSAMAYYVERRCRHLSSGETRDFWHRIVESYRKVVNVYGAEAVARVQGRAEADADTLDCGEPTVQLVKAAYSQTRRF